MAANVLAGLGAGLQGGLRAFQGAQALEEEKRQFNEQQALQQRLLQRSLMRDELDELKQQEEAQQNAFTRAITLAQQFGGQKVPEGAVANLSPDLRSLVSKPAEQTLPSTQIGGYSNTAGAKQEGAVNFDEKAGTPEGMVEITMPESEKARIAQNNSLASLARAQMFAGGRDADRDARNDQFQQKLAQDRELTLARIAATMANAGQRGQMTDNQTFGAIDKLNYRFNQNTKLAREMSEQAARMNVAMDGIKTGKVGLNEGTQAIINGFNRMLEPGSVTRESEYARTPEGQALLNSIIGRAEALTKGGPGVRPEELQGFVTLANTFMERANKSAAAERTRIEAYAKRFNLPMELIVADYAGAPGTQASPTSAPAPAPTPTGTTPAPAKKKFEIISVK